MCNVLNNVVDHQKAPSIGQLKLYQHSVCFSQQAGVFFILLLSPLIRYFGTSSVVYYLVRSVVHFMAESSADDTLNRQAYVRFQPGSRNILAYRLIHLTIGVISSDKGMCVCVLICVCWSVCVCVCWSVCVCVIVSLFSRWVLCYKNYGIDNSFIR